MRTFCEPTEVQRSPVIGMLMDFLVPPMIDGAGAYARQHGIRLDARWSVRADWMPERPDWDGVLVHLVDMEHAHQRAAGLGLPMVHLSGWLGNRALPRVDCDYAACGLMAAEEFRRLGLRRVAGMSGSRSGADFRSYRGLWAGVRRHGLDFVRLPAWRKDVSWTEMMRVAAREIAALAHPCGVFLPHAGATVALMDELRRLGVRIPEDVALIVIDKDPQRTTELAPVPLTAVVPDFWQQGYDAAALLHRMILRDDPRCSIRRVRPVGLVRRESTGVKGVSDPVVAKVMHLLGEPVGKTAGVAELARLAGVSRRSLEVRFRKQTGMTLHAAQMKQRMDEAKRLLGNPGTSVTEVAFGCGFSSVHYFTTAFKREVGITPGAYQRARGAEVGHSWSGERPPHHRPGSGRGGQVS